MRHSINNSFSHDAISIIYGRKALGSFINPLWQLFHVVAPTSRSMALAYLRKIVLEFHQWTAIKNLLMKKSISPPLSNQQIEVRILDFGVSN